MKKAILHVHTRPRSSDSSLRPEEAVAAARRLGAKVLVFTEHEVSWERDELAALSREVGGGVLLLGARELSCPDAHLVVVGCACDFDPLRPIADVVRGVHQRGGAVVLAHPADLHFQIQPALAAEWGVDAAEVSTARKRSVPPDRWDEWRARNIALTAGLDAHKPSDMKPGFCNLVPDRVESEQDLARALRERKIHTNLCRGEPTGPCPSFRVRHRYRSGV